MLVDDAFWDRLLDLEARTNIAAEEALKVFVHESSLNPKAQNPGSGCVGLNQMCPGTLEGWFKGDGTAKTFTELAAQFRALPASKQLDAIETLWTSRVNHFLNGSPATAIDLEWLNFLPATFEPTAGDDYLIAPDGLRKLGWSDADIVTKVLDSNPIFLEEDARGLLGVKNKPAGTKWAIPVGAIAKRMNIAAATPTYQAAVALLDKARANRPIGPPPPAPIPPMVSGPARKVGGRAVGITVTLGIAFAAALAWWFHK